MATWYYESEGLQIGPFTDEEFTDLVRQGKVQPKTLVWNETLTGWKPYSDLTQQPAAARPSAAPIPPNVVACSECGNLFRPEELIQVQGRHVCATCKPIVVQRLKEGVMLGSSDPDVLIEDFRRRDYEVEIGPTLTNSWEIVKANFWPSVGVTFIITLIQQGPGIIPILGPIASLILMGPLYGGLYYFFLKLLRGEPAEIGDGFKGFGPRFWQLVGAQLIPILIAYLFFIPAVAAAIALGAIVEPGSSLPLIVAGGLALLALPFVIYFTLCWIFSVPLVMDKGLRFWDAMNVSRKAVSMHWGSVFLFYLVTGGLVNIVGLLACCVGVFVTLPVSFVSSMSLYENIFSGPKSTAVDRR